MKLTKAQQIRSLKKLFGSKADLFNFNDQVDARLSYEENKRIILAKARRRGITRKTKMTFRGTPVFLVDKAEQLHAKRNIRSKAQDNVQTARRVFRARILTVEQFQKWKRNKHRYDIVGVDSKGSYAKSKKQKKLTIREIDELDIL